MWFVGEQRRSFCGRSRWMVGGPRWVALSCRGESSGNFRPLSRCSQPSRVASILPTAEVSHSRQRENNRPALTWPTRQKQPKKEYLQPRNLRDISKFLSVLNFSTKMKNGPQQNREAVPQNSSSKREKEFLECNEFSLCEHVWTSVEAVRVQRIVAGFLRNIDNVCGHWAIIEKGFKSFLLSWTQKQCIVNAFSDVDDKLVFHLFCILLSIF